MGQLPMGGQQPPMAGPGMMGQQQPMMGQSMTNMGGGMGQPPMAQPPQMGQPQIMGQQPPMMQPPQPQGMNMLAPSQSINQAGFNNSMVGALVPSNVQSNPYSLGGSGGSVVPSSGGSVMGGSVAGNSIAPQMMMNAPSPYGQPPQLQNGANSNALANPFGAPQPLPAPQPAPYGQPPSQPQLAMDPFAAAPQQQQAMVASDPWGNGSVVSQPPPPAAPAQIASDPWGAAPSASAALVPSTAANDDPFGIFGTQPSQPSPQQQQMQQQMMSAGPPLNASVNSMPPQPSVENDPWAEMGFGSPQPAPAPLPDEGDLFDGGIGAAAARAQREANLPSAQPAAAPQPSPSKSSRTKGELPPGGEWYDAKIFTPTLGVMFFKPKELTDSLFLNTPKHTVEALEDRPVVAFIVEGSSARSAGVELGHVLLKVNGIDVKNPKEASRLIKEGPRPLPLLFYVPDVPIVVAEGEHMVKYNTKETSAPNSAKDWKPKYVVVGGIIAQPWMINMYRSKVRYRLLMY